MKEKSYTEEILCVYSNPVYIIEMIDDIEGICGEETVTFINRGQYKYEKYEITMVSESFLYLSISTFNVGDDMLIAKTIVDETITVSMNFILKVQQ